MSGYLSGRTSLTTVQTADLADDAVTEAKMATDAIGLTELKAGTDGELISWDASGNPAAVAVGTATHVLTSNGAGAAPTFAAAAAGGAWNLIGTQTCSTSSTLTQTGIDSTYDLYVIHISDLVTSNDSIQIRARLGDSGGIDSGGSDYEYHVSGGRTYGSGSLVNLAANASFMQLSREGQGNVSGEASHFTIYLNTGGTSSWPSISGFGYSYDSYLNNNHHAAVRKSLITTDRFQIYPTSGTLNEGRMTVWGISHA